MIQNFEWDAAKNDYNVGKHGVAFLLASQVFRDEFHFITLDTKHSDESEKRYFCYGLVDGKVLTVRFTYRQNRIRIIGAAYWTNGAKLYEQRNRI